ncbi:hypothetical protein C2S52_004305 [Perilla frutescens var. hirtella]|nr:hypothetical protein C2S52_004305 [Perilla frutescens var. hirtella]
MDTNKDQQQVFVVIQEVVQDIKAVILLMNFLYLRLRGRMSGECRTKQYSLKEKVSKQLEHMHDLVNFDDATCVDHLRMDRNSFGRLCYLLENVGGLLPSRHVQVPEQVAIFLSILAHHTKNRIVKTSFKRSGYTISKHFNAVLKSLLKLHTILLVNPQPVEEDSTNDRWKYFKGCLGALDGTYIPVKVLQSDKARYRNRKGNVTVNVLAVCDRNMNYVYVLTGWEGSAADSRVLRDAITRPNGLKIPTGSYYLCDGGYTNANGFLAPYRGVRYHLQEWDGASSGPQNSQEYFNLKHAKARNVIEWSFGLLKGRWAILRSNSFYPIKLHMDISGNNSARVGKKTDKSRRCWSSLEEQQLIVALKEVVTRGWKCENGFKTGYLGVLEQLMLQALPGTDLKAEPHINSKIHVWRKNYASLSTMVSRSGFGWNDSTHTIEVDNDQIWENYVKTDSNARTMRYKPWPFYKDWCEIFGKDRATGEHAEAFADIVQDLLHKSQESPYTSNDNEYDPFTYLNEESEAALDDMSIHGEGTGSSAKVTSKGKGKKRKAVDSLDDRFIDLMTTFCEKTDSRLGELAKRIGFEHDASMSRKKVFEVLGTMNQLSDEQQIYMAKYLCNNTKDLDLFFSLPDEKQVVMVRMIISGKI